MNGRVLLVVLLVLAAVLTGVSRHLAMRERDRQIPPVDADASLGQVSSFSLAMFLGGLRGPLATWLWASSEGQKSRRDLEDIDTKIELIRLLQSEFDSVHIFQMWNKGYNLSAQRASVAGRYSAILDAIEYGRRVQRQRPDNINIIYEVGRLFTHKLGDAAERVAFARRTREQTLPPEPRERLTIPAAGQTGAELILRRAGLERPARQFARGEDDDTRTLVAPAANFERVRDRLLAIGGRFEPVVEAVTPASRLLQPTRLPVMLDASGAILPELAAGELRHLAGLTEPDGTPMRFPDGLTPHALGFNYHREAQLLYFAGRQHLQYSGRVVSSAAPLAMQKWAEEQLIRGRQAEIESLLSDTPRLPDITDLFTREVLYASLLPPDGSLEPLPLLDSAIFNYRRSARLAELSIDFFEQHLAFGTNRATDRPIYRSHMMTARMQHALLRADADFLEALRGDRPDRQSLLRSAREGYLAAQLEVGRLMLGFATEPPMVLSLFPQGRNDPLTKFETLEALDDQTIRDLTARLLALAANPWIGFYHRHREIIDNAVFFERAARRLAVIDTLLSQTALGDPVGFDGGRW